MDHLLESNHSFAWVVGLVGGVKCNGRSYDVLAETEQRCGGATLTRGSEAEELTGAIVGRRCNAEPV